MSEIKPRNMRLEEFHVILANMSKTIEMCQLGPTSATRHVKKLSKTMDLDIFKILSGIKEREELGVWNLRRLMFP
jgi:hypothetical protein